MNCRICAKVIPDGFVDCPWCGATGATLAASPFDSVKSSHSGVGTILLSFASLGCFAGIVLLSYLATLREYGPWAKFRYPQVSGSFIGRCLGAYILPALCVFLYYKIRRKSRGDAERFLIISGWALFSSLLAFAGTRPRYRNPFGLPILPEAARTSSALPRRTVAPTKWDPAIRSFYSEVRSFNEQYMGEISKLDTSAMPLYTAESFTDAARIHQALSQLQARLDVARRFSKPETLLSKMPEYAGSIEADDTEKKDFLAGFDASARKDLQQHKAVSAAEQDWLQNSIVLYQFALAQQGAYSIREGRVVFQRKAAGADFDRKLEIARLSRLDFLRTYGRYVATQNSYLAQLGLPPLSPGGPPPPESSVSKFLSGTSPGTNTKTNQ